jgi:hypothetical protein
MSTTKYQIDWDAIPTLALEGLDFIMEQFQDVNGFKLPRKISTGATNLNQVSLNSRADILYYFKSALYEECRINAYPDFEVMKQNKMISQDYKPVPNHIFIDLDRKSFETEEQFENTTQMILKNVNENIQCDPFSGTPAADNVTIIQSGNGHHIHIPIHWNRPLEDSSEFANFANNNQDLATRFIRWAERELSRGLADKHHNPSIKSCLFRVPGTINTEARDNGLDPIVRVKKVGDWINTISRPTPGLPTQLVGEVKPEFLMKFHSTLVQEIIDDKVAKMEKRDRLSKAMLRADSNSAIIIQNKWAWWIEPILQRGFTDNRKDLMYWVLAPYLITVKGLDYDKAYTILEIWLNKCDKVKGLEPSWTYFRYRIRYCLDVAENEERWPITFDSFKEHYPELYENLKGGEFKAI